MGKPWIFTSNTFNVQTETNYKRMLSLDADHYAKLLAQSGSDPDILAIKTEYEPFHNAYVGLYASWRGAEGTHESKTATVEEKFKELNTLLKVWEGKVYSIFPEDTPEAINIFPDKRKPFQEGTYEQRISAIKTLFSKLGDYTTEPVLVALSATVETFFNSLELARATQQGVEISISDLSNMLESQRQLCATAMYGTLGKLMYKFRTDSVRIEEYWDMTLLRNLTPEAFVEDVEVDGSGLLPSSMTAEDMEKLKPATRIFARNNSPVDVNLRLGFSETKDTPAPMFITLAALTEAEHAASELGYSSSRKFLVYQNPDAETGTLHVEVNL